MWLFYYKCLRNGWCCDLFMWWACLFEKIRSGGNTNKPVTLTVEIVTSGAMIRTCSEILEIHYCTTYLLLWGCVTQSYHQYQSRCLWSLNIWHIPLNTFTSFSTKSLFHGILSFILSFGKGILSRHIIPSYPFSSSLFSAISSYLRLSSKLSPRWTKICADFSTLPRVLNTMPTAYTLILLSS